MDQKEMWNYSKIETILKRTHYGLWRIEMDEGKQPRMYCDDAMHELLGVKSRFVSAEECFEMWYSGVEEEHIEIVQKTIADLLEKQKAEVIYPWRDAAGRLSVVRCGGVMDASYKDGIALIGYHADITKTLVERREHLKLANLPMVLQAEYYVIYSCDFKTGTITLEQSMDTIFKGYGLVEEIPYLNWLTNYIDQHVAEENRNDCAEFGNLQALKDALHLDGFKSLLFERKHGKEHRFTEWKMFPIEYEGEDIVRAILVEKDVDDVILRERENQNLLKASLAREEQVQRTLDIMIYDRLTGLHCKEYFYELAQEMLVQFADKEFIFLVIDIEDFKSFNSIAGVEEGDLLIRFMGESIRAYLENEVYVAFGRSQADVFVVMMEHNHAKIEALQNHLLQVVKQYPQEAAIKLVFGEYLIVEHHEALHLAHDKAILAAKTCKGQFGKHVGYYTQDMDEALKVERQLVQDMERGIEDEEFEVYFQPKYNIQTLEIVGAEALVRWKHRHKQLLSPALFIPLFEKNGFIRNLDYYVWEKVCKFIQENQIAVPLSINVSRANMYSTDLEERILALSSSFGVTPKQLYLEFTESAYYNDVQAMQKLLQRLKDYGFVTSMDDFGNGYSSLGVLKDMPLNELKIDMAFVRYIEEDEKAVFILETIVLLCKRLGLHVTVEGIETKGQLEIVKRLGCDTAQGYYLARPIPMEEFLALLQG